MADKKKQSRGKNKKSPQLTKAEKIALATKICDLYREDTITIVSCCEAFNVSPRTFHYWTKEVTEVADIYKKAKQGQDTVYLDRIKTKARTNLEKLIEGYEVTEHREETDFKGAKRTVDITKQIQPSATAVIFALTNTDPDNFKHRQDVKHSGKIEGDGKTYVFKVGNMEIEFS